MFVAPAVCPGIDSACGHPYTWAGSTVDAWAGAVDTRAEDHEELEGTGRPGERTHMTMAGWDAPEQSPYGAPGDNSGERGTSLLTHYSHCI